MVHIRNAVPEDAGAMSCLLASSWKSAYRGIVHDEYLDSLDDSHWMDFLRAGIEKKTICAMVLEEERNLIGSAVLGDTENENEAHLISFYLLPEKMGHGFGHAFLSGIETELMGRGYTACVLDVLEHNGRAIRFYEAHGFVDTNKRISAKLGECEYDCKVYEKSLLR